MPKHEAVKALEIYKRAGQQVVIPVITYRWFWSNWQRLFFFFFFPWLTWLKTQIYEGDCWRNWVLNLQAGGLSDFYEICRGLELARNFQFPVLREVIMLMCIKVILPSLHEWYSLNWCIYNILVQPPQSFLTTMEEYIREAPRMVSVSREPLVSIIVHFLILLQSHMHLTQSTMF